MGGDLDEAFECFVRGGDDLGEALECFPRAKHGPRRSKGLYFRAFPLCTPSPALTGPPAPRLPRPTPRGGPDASRPAYERLPAEAFARVREATGALARHDLEAEFELGLGAMLRDLEALRYPRG